MTTADKIKASQKAHNDTSFAERTSEITRAISSCADAMVKVDGDDYKERLAEVIRWLCEALLAERGSSVRANDLFWMKLRDARRCSRIAYDLRWRSFYGSHPQLEEGIRFLSTPPRST